MYHYCIKLKNAGFWDFTISIFSFSPLFTFSLGEDRIQDIKFGRFIQGHFPPFQQPVQATSKKKKQHPGRQGRRNSKLLFSLELLLRTELVAVTAFPLSAVCGTRGQTSLQGM